MGCDFLAFSAHKLLGPMGVGVLWARADRLSGMPAYQVGSNMAHGVDIESATPEEGALRFQAGTPNASGAVGLAAALEVLERVGLRSVGDFDAGLVAYAEPRLRAIPGLRLLGTAADLTRYSASRWRAPTSAPSSGLPTTRGWRYAAATWPRCRCWSDSA
jgi:cysteine desulfurase/selenocysteine lyase